MTAKECNALFERLVRALTGKLGLDKCYMTDKWIGQAGFTLRESEPDFGPADVSQGTRNAKVCCFGNADETETGKALCIGMEKLGFTKDSGHGIPGVTAIALVGSRPDIRMIYVFTEKTCEAISFSYTCGIPYVSESPFLEGTEFGNFHPNRKMTADDAREIRRIARRMYLSRSNILISETKRQLKDYAARNNLSERQVIRVMHARTADELLDALAEV